MIIKNELANVEWSMKSIYMIVINGKEEKKLFTCLKAVYVYYVQTDILIICVAVNCANAPYWTNSLQKLMQVDYSPQRSEKDDRN